MICVATYPSITYIFVADIFSTLNKENMEAQVFEDSVTDIESEETAEEATEELGA